MFTEQGVAMLSGVLRSKKAIEVNIQIMREFVRMRKLMIRENFDCAAFNELRSFVLENSRKTTQEIRKIWIVIDRL